MSFKKSALFICASILCIHSTHAHYPFVAPLNYQNFNNQSAIIAGFYDNPFASEVQIKNFQFHIISPNGTKTEIQEKDWIHAGSLSNYNLNHREDGSYRIQGTRHAQSSQFANVNGQWKTLLPNQPNKTKPTPEHVIFKHQLKPNAVVKTVQTQEVIETVISRRAITNRALAITGKGFEIEFISHPNAIKINQPVQLRLLNNGKPIADTEVKLFAQTHDFSRNATQASYRTNANGEFNFILTQKDQYLLKVDYQEPFNTPEQELNRYKYTLSFNAIQ
ncbi:DUF4198 domain-containing protein [Acinetobacter bouvetii]|uniref:Nickel uptake substrate-specific transmembrane region n=1 Tax=Acinetobacter bouvetii TaxID=202951 RepID=A0A811G846_9GAMM|nr:DUF4198 domain-containing protein [Acinetobacter bouvetii]CAB1212344.1 Nickel uptake substrate-specific transmembrane region [Acinetobacter bouvetii]